MLPHLRLGAGLAAAVATAAAVAASAPAQAQSSASFRMTESTLNGGGRPSQGQVATSANFRVSLDAIGEGAAEVGLASAGYTVDGAFVPAYRPPLEVSGLRLTSTTDLTWDYEPSVGSFNLYRGAASTLPGDYGACLQPSLPVNGAFDAALPSSGASFTYLVTAENRLREEGTPGHASSGAVRPNTQPCP